MKNIIKLISLGIWIYAIYLLKTTGKINDYITLQMQIFVSILYISLIILFSIELFNYIISFFKKKKYHHCDCHKDHSHLESGSIIEHIIFIIPVIQLWIINPSYLGSYSVNIKGGIKSNISVETKHIEKKEIKNNIRSVDILYLNSKYKKDPKILEKKLYKFNGFLYLNNEFGEYKGIVRFLITCCAADARPIGVLLDFKDIQNKTDFKKGDWIEVIAKLNGNKILDEIDIPVFKIKNIKKIKKPTNQYLSIYSNN